MSAREPMVVVREALDRAGCRPNGAAHDFRACCPAHGGTREDTLHVTRGDDGRALLVCHADGCTAEAIVAALDIEMSALFADGGGVRAAQRIVATYPYTDERGKLLYEVVRYGPKKTFRQRRPNGRDGWTWKVRGARRTLYRLPRVVEAVAAGSTVYVVEGEKDVEAIERAGATATCNPGGAGKWGISTDCTSVLRGAHVVIVCDRDDPGRAHGEQVRASLDGVAASVRVVEPVEGKDAADHLAAGHGLDDFTAAQAGEQVPEGPVEATDALLARVLGFIEQYVALPGDAERVALALFVLHTWAFEAAHATPYLLVLSPERRAGKTRLLETLELLIARPWRVAAASESAMFRKISSAHPTLLLDEIDAIFGSNTERTEPLRAVLNAGNRPGSCVARCVGEGSRQEVHDFDVFGPKVLAGIDTGRLPDTIVDRAITVAMKRKTNAEPVARFRHRHADAAAVPLREDLHRWAASEVERLRDADPLLPDQLNDRAGEAWEPLFAIADHAGAAWGARARDAAVRLNAGGEEDEASRGARLLADIRAAFGDALAVSTEALLAYLNTVEESPWGGWHEGNGMRPRDLARLLKPYAVKPRTVKLSDGRTPKGYHRDALEDAWARYCPPLYLSEAQPPPPPPPARNHGADSVADTPPPAPPEPPPATKTPPETPHHNGKVAQVAEVADLTGGREGDDEPPLATPEQEALFARHVGADR